MAIIGSNIILGNTSFINPIAVKPLSSCHVSLQEYARNSICYSDGRYCVASRDNGSTRIVMVGYIYGLGCSAEASSEIMLAAYQDSGIDKILNYGGVYSVFLVDKAAGLTYLFCDNGGQRRIYYHTDGSSLVFSTKLSGVLAAGGLAAKENLDARTFFFVYGFYPGEDTVYEGVKSLHGDRYIEISNGKMGVRKKPERPSACNTYFYGEDSIKDENTVADLLYQKLVKAIAEQTAGIDQIAVLLGGFDSALVASLIKRAGKQVETFSFYYNDQRYNQPHTDTLAQFLGIKHNWVKIDFKVIENGLLDYVSVFDQPTNWPNYVIQTKCLVTEIKNRGFNVCFTGDGCDNLFYGYPGVFKNAQLYGGIFRIPQLLVSVVEFLARPSIIERVLGHPYRLGLRLCRNMAKTDPERSFLSFRVFDELTIKNIFQKPLGEVREELARNLAIVVAGIPNLSSPALAYQGKAAISPNRAKLIGSGDAGDVALFSPYMHPEVKKLVALLPEKLLRPTDDVNDIGKYILVLCARLNRLLPDEIIYQKKVAAVDAPIDHWYQTALKQPCLEMLKASSLGVDTMMVEALFGDKLTERLYKRHYPVADSLTTHVLSLLLTYSRYFAVPEKQKIVKG